MKLTFSKVCFYLSDFFYYSSSISIQLNVLGIPYTTVKMSQGFELELNITCEVKFFRVHECTPDQGHDRAETQGKNTHREILSIKELHTHTLFYILYKYRMCHESLLFWCQFGQALFFKSVIKHFHVFIINVVQAYIRL